MVTEGSSLEIHQVFKVAIYSNMKLSKPHSFWFFFPFPYLESTHATRKYHEICMLVINRS